MASATEKKDEKAIRVQDWKDFTDRCWLHFKAMRAEYRESARDCERVANERIRPRP